eukprot:6328957-Pyramimonas_sp.AAC.1
MASPAAAASPGSPGVVATGGVGPRWVMIRRMASAAASLTRAERSAPTYPGVARARARKFRSPERRNLAVITCIIHVRTWVNITRMLFVTGRVSGVLSAGGR